MYSKMPTEKIFEGLRRPTILRNSDFTMSHMIGYVSNIILNMNIHVLMRGFRKFKLCALRTCSLSYDVYTNVYYSKVFTWSLFPDNV